MRSYLKKIAPAIIAPAKIAPAIIAPGVLPITMAYAPGLLIKIGIFSGETISKGMALGAIIGFWAIPASYLSTWAVLLPTLYFLKWKEIYNLRQVAIAGGVIGFLIGSAIMMLFLRMDSLLSISVLGSLPGLFFGLSTAVLYYTIESRLNP